MFSLTHAGAEEVKLELNSITTRHHATISCPFTVQASSLSVVVKQCGVLLMSEVDGVHVKVPVGNAGSHPAVAGKVEPGMAVAALEVKVKQSPASGSVVPVEKVYKQPAAMVSLYVPDPLIPSF